MNNKKEIFLVPYAHLDTQWRWEYPTTIKKYIKNTLDENIKLFEKYSDSPGHVFNFTGALRYEMMKEYYPEKFRKVVEYVKENRWNFVGTCLDETDPLTPSVESMIRNILYGDRWARKEFGKSSKDYMIPDCFGFPANMPSVLRHCGIEGFSTQKLTWNSAMGIPFEIGIWKGPDGSELVSALNPGSYTGQLHNLVYKIPDRMKSLYKLGEKNGIWKSFQYYGVGDIGGAPKEESVKNAIESIKNAQEFDPNLIIRQGAPDVFFKEITTEEKGKMDRFSGDLLLINHSAGTLTSATIMKRWNRKNEQLGFAAEVASVMAYYLTGLKYPKEKILTAWYKTIGNQMHDILPGTSTPLAYEYSHNDEIIALKTWSAILEDAAKAIAPIIMGNGNIILFNPLGVEREEVIELRLKNWNEEMGFSAIAFDSEKRDTREEIPVQIAKKYDEIENNHVYIGYFLVKLPPFSWKRYSILPNPSTKNRKIIQNKNIENKVQIINENGKYKLENWKYLITITGEGAIISIYDKLLQKELLKRPIAYEFQKERPKLYPAWNMDWKDRKKPPFKRIEKGSKINIIENGPIRCTIQIITKYKKSLFIKEISLSQKSETIEFIEKIKWREMGCSLKLALDTTMEQPISTFNWETSRTNRGINNDKLFEMPSRFWVDLSQDDWGVSIVEDSKYGYDRPKPNKIRMTLIYTPGLWYAQGFWDQKWHDWGNHTIRYAIYSHKGDFKGTDVIARKFNQPIRTFMINKIGTNEKTNEKTNENNPFKLESKAFVRVSNPQVGILALKKAEDEDGIIIRFYERYGTDAKAEISFISEIVDLYEVSGIEEIIGKTQFKENKFNVEIEANGIKTYLIKLREININQPIKQKQVILPYNTKKIGTKDYQKINNNNENIIFPIELVPEKIYAGKIEFYIEKNKDLNAVACNNQIIKIPEGFNTVSILVSASDETIEAFKILDQENKVIKEKEARISKIIGFQGQWDRRIWLKQPKHHLQNKRDYMWINLCVGVKPGFINRNRVEWFSNHIIKDGEIVPYHYGYLYNLSFTIPKEGKYIKFPKNQSVFVFGMTVSQQQINVESLQVKKDIYDF